MTLQLCLRTSVHAVYKVLMGRGRVLCGSQVKCWLLSCVRLFGTSWWPKYWSFNFSISPSSEYSGLISFRMDWLDLLAVQGLDMTEWLTLRLPPAAACFEMFLAFQGRKVVCLEVIGAVFTSFIFYMLFSHEFVSIFKHFCNTWLFLGILCALGLCDASFLVFLIILWSFTYWPFSRATLVCIPQSFNLGPSLLSLLVPGGWSLL